MNELINCYDVTVVGGGHAGVEAALAAARLGCRALLITSRLRSLAMMPCNPSIGGLAKSHLVHELDVLGGEMPRNADFSGLQYRTLNASRGPAVRATRIQCDKKAYSRRMTCVVQDQSGLDVLEDECTAVVTDGDGATGVRCAAAGLITSRTVVLATGTALRGRIYIGDEISHSDGDRRPTANLLSESLEMLGFRLFRLKTGTPPRLLAASIDWEKTAVQVGDHPPPRFSWHSGMFHVEHLKSRNNEKLDRFVLPGFKQHSRVAAEQPECSTWNNSAQETAKNDAHGAGIGYVEALRRLTASGAQLPCWLTHTTAHTHQIIRDHLSDSALYGGLISGAGVRYCPSIEDKIVKFSDVEQHHVFLEPEGLETDWIYPNGLSNSLPREVQQRMVQSVPGLESAEIDAYGYAIEYDAIDARELRHTLECKRIASLYFAGQVNGTTGYEEAAVQGFMAGVNAALKVTDGEPLVLSRQQAYIGVLIDDLVTKGTDEPYRMFTSRAERRLILRQDNARYRLHDAATALGLVESARLDESVRFDRAAVAEIERLRGEWVNGENLLKLLKRPGAHYNELPDHHKELAAAVVEQIEIRVKYEGYIERERKAAERALREEGVVIPDWVDYWQIPALRYESREKLARVKPENLGQAARITGVNPADIAVLSLIIRRGKL